jgi:hypothetical protein
MQPWILFATITGTFAVVGVGVVLVVLTRNARAAQGPTMQGKYPKGHWMSVGMCIGIALGCIPSFVGLLFDQMAPFVGIGPAIGCGLGVAIGSALERKHKDELRPPTEAEQQARFRLTLAGLVALALLVLSLFVLGGMAVFAPRETTRVFSVAHLLDSAPTVKRKSQRSRAKACANLPYSHWGKT